MKITAVVTARYTVEIDPDKIDHGMSLDEIRSRAKQNAEVRLVARSGRIAGIVLDAIDVQDLVISN